jgi:uroporphyrinogen-III synthase
LVSGQVDVAIFTSSIQLEHLLEIAREMGHEDEVYEALAHGVAIASVGPVMTATLEAAGLPPDIVPLHPKMPALVKASADLAARVLETKSGRNQRSFSRTR